MLKEIHWEPQSHCLRSEKLTVDPDELCCCQRPLVALLELLSLCARLWTPPHDRQGSYQQQQRRRHGGGRDGSLSAVTTPEVGWLHFHFYLFRVNLCTLTSSAIYSMDVHMYCGAVLTRKQPRPELRKNLKWTHTETFIDLISSL